MSHDPYQLPTASRSNRFFFSRVGLLALGFDALLASMIAAQRFARHFHFDPRLGVPWVDLRAERGLAQMVVGLLALASIAMLWPRVSRPFSFLLAPVVVALGFATSGPLYSPLLWILWRRAMGRSEVPLFAQAGQTFLISIALLATSTVAFLVLYSLNLRPRGDTHGSAHWADGRDLKRSGLLRAKRGVVLATVGHGGRQRTLRDASDRHVLLFAPSGSGKTTSVVLPTLREWPGSVVVSDIKAELWHKSAAHRRDVLGQRCWRFDPSCPDGSTARYNPVLAIPRGLGDVAAAQALATILANPDGKDREADFWEVSSRSLLTGLLLHVRYAEEEPTLATAARLLTNQGEGVEKFLNALLTASHDPLYLQDWRNAAGNPTATHPAVAQAARAVLDIVDKTRSGVIATALNHLEVFRDPIVAANTSESDFTAADFLDAESAASLYLTIAPAELGRLRALVRIVVQQLTRAWTTSLDPERATQPFAAGRSLLVVLEEFTAWGRLDFLDQSIAYLRGYGVKLLISIQSLSQLTQTYGPHTAIPANCGVQMAFAPNDLATAEHLSKMTGTRTVHFERRSFAGGGGLFAPAKVNDQPIEVARPLLTADEVRRMEREECLVFVAGCSVIRGRRLGASIAKS